MTTNEKISALRKLMSEKNIDAWIVPSADPHQSEYVAPCWKSRAWLSNFTGSAGTIVVTQKKSGLWTDSRYYLQATKEIENSEIELFKSGLPDVPTYLEWLDSELPDESTIGFDGKVLSINQVKNLKNKLSGMKLNYLENLIDEIWLDAPKIPQNPVMELDPKFTGESREDKFKRVREKMSEMECNYHVISSLDDIAWLLNIRGTDIDYNPVVISYVLVSKIDVVLFVNSNKLSKIVIDNLEKDGVIFQNYEDIFGYLSQLLETKILLDPDKTSQTLRDSIPENCEVILEQNITIPMKAEKNEIEIEGIRQAHIQDGVAMVKWLFWINENVGNIEMDEVSVAEKLERLRSLRENIKGLSFNSIVGYKENGAIVHYSAKRNTAKKIVKDGILLIDSGGQYLTGTTDITRTINFSKPTEIQKFHYTLVLKGHIDLATAIFPDGTTGSQIDTFARAALWNNGLNYGHGTGHGVGHFLGVHEGPQSISSRSKVPLKKGMVCSNEPGIYIENEYGIRIENVVVVEEKIVNSYGTFLGFENLTICPYAKDLIKIELLTKQEKNWLNNYNKEVFTKISPFLSIEEKQWLEEMTKEI